MRIYQLTITLEDHLYHATQEVGRAFLTGRYLHNYGLSYALGLVHGDYHDAVQVPRYREQLAPLNQAGVYVTPGRPLRVNEVIHTFKLADTRYHVEMTPTSINIPNFGRVRELAAGSCFVAYVLSREALKLPRWIRLGKWMSKAEVQVMETAARLQPEGRFVCAHPLNPADLGQVPRVFDLIPMPPVSLVENATLQGQAYAIGAGRDRLLLPLDLAYGAAVGA